MTGYTLVLTDGPVRGHWDTGRAPLALRAARRLDSNRRSVLADPGEKPHPQEMVYLYRRPTASASTFVRGRRVYEYQYVGELDHLARLIPGDPLTRDADAAWWDGMRANALHAWQHAAPAIGTDHRHHVQDTLNLYGSPTP